MFISICLISFQFAVYYILFKHIMYMIKRAFHFYYSRFQIMASFISFKYKKIFTRHSTESGGHSLVFVFGHFSCIPIFKSSVLLEIHVIDSFKIFFFCFNFCLFYVIVTFTSQNLFMFLNLAMLEVDVALSFGLMGLCNKRKIFGKKKYGDKINMDGWRTRGI